MSTSDAPRGPRCHCGTSITRIPGKRPKVYCSDRCRMAAKRIIAADLAARGAAPSDPKKGHASGKSEQASADHKTAGQAPDSPTTERPGFSTTARKASAPGQEGGHGGGRDARFERREAHQTVALGKRFCGCGTRLTGGAASVQLGEKSASFGGAQTCGSVHQCVWCSAKILAVRADNAQAMADALAKAGYGLYLGTHTLRHYARMKYGSLRRGKKADGTPERGGLIAVAHDGWENAFARAGRPWRRMRDTFGIVGYERAFEDTWGSGTGHHIHWHVLWVTQEPLSEEEFRAFRRCLAETWRDAVADAGGYEVSTSCTRPNCPCEGTGHGSDLRPLNVGEEGDAARYLYKDGDKGTAGFGVEFTRSDLKDGRTWGRMSPFQLGDLAAEEFAELGRPGPLTKAYREREYGVSGVKKHRRTPSLNKILKALEVEQDERAPEEIAADETEARTVLAVIPSATWYRHIVRRRGRRLAVLRAAEALGEIGVRTLIESWGLVWGVDVLPAPSP